MAFVYFIALNEIPTQLFGEKEKCFDVPNMEIL
jgi:hypothetical protein